MSIQTKSILLAVATISVLFAGCVSSEDPTDPAAETDSQTIELGNRGAINGLVVDDNYRPVQLKEEWGNSGPGEFQDLGFVLILETGQRFPTTENGEFQVLPLQPGAYTIRVAADNHEAKDTKVNVVSGEYTEITLEARRQYSDGGSILSQEQVLFMACYASAVVAKAALASVANNGCGDLSGDSSRFDFMTDFANLQPDLRGVVTEMRASKDWPYSVTVRIVGEGCDYSAGYCYFGDATTKGKYTHLVLYPDQQFMGKGEYLQEGQAGHCQVGVDSKCPEYAFTVEYPFQTALFTGHPTDDVIAPGCEPSKPARDAVTNAGGFGGCNGAGLSLGIKAQFVQNVFLYELPEEGIEDYCVLCDDANIPE